MSDVTNGVFSDYCYDMMWDLFKTPEDEVGSEFPGNKSGRSITNCIIYVSNVLIYAHAKIGRGDIGLSIEKLGKKEQDGTKLAKYLIGQIGWKAHYWNPDVKNPRDGKDEHSFSYKEALRLKSYYKLPLSGVIVDYNLQNKANENTAILNKLSQVKFAFGIARGGYHTFLVSKGEVFEVHWDQEGSRLYGKKAFKDYEWLSGVLVVPPDSTFTSDAIKAR